MALLFLILFSTQSLAISQWKTVLSLVNTPDSASPFSRVLPLEENLQALHESELLNIEKRWKEEGPKGLKSKKMLRDSKNLFYHQEITKLNSKTLAFLESESKASTGIDYREKVARALKEIELNPKTNPEGVYHFKDGDQIGFCFSRALLVHYYLLKGGVPQNEIAKIFTLGDLQVQGTLWKFHVAILVRDSKEGFIVADPLHKQFLPYKEWLKINSAYEIKTPLSRARFYLTSPRKFLPAFGAYDMKQLEDPHLREYFKNLNP